MLQAGVDPLAANNDGQTFLHIIIGRFEAQNVANGAPWFKNERLAKTKWFFEDRVELIEMLSQELSPTYTALLAKAQDKNGNTVLHEYALSTSTVEHEFVEKKICKNLLKFGASLRVTNNSGDVPLHYAYTPELFKIFLQNGAVCRARNDRDESPVLFILKMSAELAFAQTSAITELANQAFVKTTSTRSVQEAVKLLENLKSIVSFYFRTNVKFAYSQRSTEAPIVSDASFEQRKAFNYCSCYRGHCRRKVPLFQSRLDWIWRIQFNLSSN